jgi:hypothetical protein
VRSGECRATNQNRLPRQIRESGHPPIALAHKLIRTIYVILARRKPYRDSTFDYEAASVAKNAPRWIRALKKYGYWPQPASAT